MKRWQGIGELTCLKINHLLNAEDLKQWLAAQSIHEGDRAVCRSKINTNYEPTHMAFKGCIELRDRFLWGGHCFGIHD